MCIRSLKLFRVLVVDDSTVTREMIEHALRQKGYAVNGVADGGEALERVTEANKSDHPYDAILLDYAMPGIDGLTCALKIREQEEKESRPEVKLYFFTAHDELNAAPALEKLNAKPWSKLNLVEMIKDLDQWSNCLSCL